MTLWFFCWISLTYGLCWDNEVVSITGIRRLNLFKYCKSWSESGRVLPTRRTKLENVQPSTRKSTVVHQAKSECLHEGTEEAVWRHTTVAAPMGRGCDVLLCDVGEWNISIRFQLSKCGKIESIMALINSCVLFSSIEFRMHGSCNAEGSLVCTLAKETSVCHSQPGSCSILASCTWNTWRLEVGKFIWEITSSKSAGTQHYCLSVLQTKRQRRGVKQLWLADDLQFDQRQIKWLDLEVKYLICLDLNDLSVHFMLSVCFV